MDPNATLQLIRDAIGAQDIIAAREALATLQNWFDRGGYVPANYYTVLAAYNILEIQEDPYLLSNPW